MVVKMALIGLFWLLVAFFIGVLMLMNGWTHTGTAMLAFEAGVIVCGLALDWPPRDSHTER